MWNGTRGTRWAALAAFVVLATSAVASARVHCLPRTWHDGEERTVCALEADVCRVPNEPGDYCMGFSESPACTTQAAMYCFVEEPAGGGSDFQCFGDRTTCNTARRYSSEVERNATSICARVTNEYPYRLHNRTVAPRVPRPPVRAE